MSNQIFRGKSYKNMISMNDRAISLTDTEGNIYSPCYMNAFGRVYYADEDDNIIFITDEALSKYIIKEINENETNTI